MAALTPTQITIVKSTAPVLKQHGQAITTHFYKSLLSAHPELKNIFSLRNQQTGAQQAALASAVVAYASHIDDLGKLSGAVERIAHKHASLFVTPEQYPIVGDHLMRAIGAVLGSALTRDVEEAWRTAYEQLAGIFVGREKELYEQAGGQENAHWRKFRIVKKEEASDSVTNFYLEPVDGLAPLPRYLPGQYVSLQISLPELDNLHQSRQYSLSEAQPEDRSHYRVSVKREPTVANAPIEDIAQGKVPGLVSNLLHDKYQVGDEVELSHPQGEFAVDATDASKADTPLVMISAGVGVTPLVAILDTVLGPESKMGKRPVSWIQASRNSKGTCFREHVRKVAREHGNVSARLFLDEVVGGDVVGEHYDFASPLRMELLDAEKDLFVGDGRAEYFVCGPVEWMLFIRRELEERGVARERMHLELFGTGDVPE